METRANGPVINRLSSGIQAEVEVLAFGLRRRGHDRMDDALRSVWALAISAGSRLLFGMTRWRGHQLRCSASCQFRRSQRGGRRRLSPQKEWPRLWHRDLAEVSLRGSGRAAVERSFSSDGIAQPTQQMSPQGQCATTTVVPSIPDQDVCTARAALPPCWRLLDRPNTRRRYRCAFAPRSASPITTSAMPTATTASHNPAALMSATSMAAPMSNNGTAIQNRNLIRHLPYNIQRARSALYRVGLLVH